MTSPDRKELETRIDDLEADCGDPSLEELYTRALKDAHGKGDYPDAGERYIERLATIDEDDR